MENRPATPRAEGLSFFVLEALSNIGYNKASTLSQAEFRPQYSSELIPRGSKTELS